MDFGEQFPTGILHNTATDRWHPISFRMAPMPGPDGYKAGRYKSVGHHTEGFATQEDAVAWVKGQPRMDLYDDVWDWDGLEIPAMVVFFIPKQGDKPPVMSESTSFHGDVS